MRLSYFQFLPLSDFLHLKSANIKIISSIFSFINFDLFLNFIFELYHKTCEQFCRHFGIYEKIVRMPTRPPFLERHLPPCGARGQGRAAHQRDGAPLEPDGRGRRRVVGQCEPCIYRPRVGGSARSAARRSRWRRTAARISASGRRLRRAYRTERLIAGRPPRRARHSSPRWAYTRTS